MKLIDSIVAEAASIAQIRKDIHAHPELCFEEVRTADLVAAKLTEWGIPIHRGLGTTGVVGIVHGKDGGACGQAVGLRADIDALPMQEVNTFEHACKHAGKMHACGHDGHTAMLLSAARHIAQHGRFSGTLNLIFQPAEEGLGGARQMMDDGLFERFPCDAIFGMHNMPGHRQGQLLLRDGATMASSDGLTITLTGKGSHGAMPHHGIDPVVAGASIVLGLQSIVARNVDPQAMAVITVGAFQAGQAHNVIPNEAVLKLSVRSLDRDVRATLLRRIEELIDAQARSFNLT